MVAVSVCGCWRSGGAGRGRSSGAVRTRRCLSAPQPVKSSAKYCKLSRLSPCCSRQVQLAVAGLYSSVPHRHGCVHHLTDLSMVVQREAHCVFDIAHRRACDVACVRLTREQRLSMCRHTPQHTHAHARTSSSHIAQAMRRVRGRLSSQMGGQPGIQHAPTHGTPPTHLVKVVCFLQQARDLLADGAHALNQQLD